MPVKDDVHDAALQSLIADGWTITKQQIAVMVEKRRLFIDIRAVKQANTIYVEVKGFEAESQANALGEALGQYLLYRYTMDYVGLEVPLFLAIPITAYQGIWSEPLGKLTRRRGRVKLIVFDPDKQEIIRWTT
jgi:hypothetical protein